MLSRGSPPAQLQQNHSSKALVFEKQRPSQGWQSLASPCWLGEEVLMLGSLYPCMCCPQPADYSYIWQPKISISFWSCFP